MVRNFIQGLLNIILNIATISVRYSKIMYKQLAKGLSIKFRSVKASTHTKHSKSTYQSQRLHKVLLKKPQQLTSIGLVFGGNPLAKHAYYKPHSHPGVKKLNPSIVRI